MNIILTHGFEANYTCGFIKGLVANGIECCVISTDESHPRLAVGGVQSLNLRGSQQGNRPLVAKVTNLLSYYIRTLWFLVRNRRSTVHFTGIFRNAVVLFEGILLNLCFKLLARRYLYTVHNVLPHNKGSSRLFHLVYCLIYHIPDRLVVHSYLAKEQLIQQFSVPPEKISVISIGINEEISVTPLTGKDARRRLGYEDEAQLVLFFGRIDEYKGLDVLINAFDQLELPTTKLLIAGAFNTKAYRRQIRAAIAAARRRTDIRLDERSIPDAEVEVFFKACDVLVLPYRNIYQSGVIFLCFNFGMPIVATDVGSFREFIEENLGIITKTNDAAGIADGIRCFFATRNRFDRDYILTRTKKYQWANVCKALIPLYDRCN